MSNPKDVKNANYQAIFSNLISVDQAVKMKSEYQENIAPLIENSKSTIENYNATEFAYLDLPTLKSYLALLEDVERANNQKISGLRIYFSAYPLESDHWEELKNPGRETFFITPTIEQPLNDGMTVEQKEFEALRNVPFTIMSKDASNPLVGDFKLTSDLLYDHDCRGGDGSAIREEVARLSSGAEISLILNELSITPPPRKP